VRHRLVCHDRAQATHDAFVADQAGKGVGHS
jgi:hypothetical protein